MHAEHAVEPDQYEPGIPDAQQAHRHILDILMMQQLLRANLGITDTLSVAINLPINQTQVDAAFEDDGGSDLDAFDSIHHRDEWIRGVGDVGLGLGWSLSGDSVTSRLRAGVRVPTGSTEPDPFRLGEMGLTHQHVFFGTGTWDPTAGIEAMWPGETWTWGGWADVRASLYDNEHGYRGPTRTTVAVTADTHWAGIDWRLSPQLYHETSATWSGAQARNSGRVDLIAEVGGRWQVEDFGIGLTVRIPRNVDTNGGQLSMPAIVMLGLSHTSELWHADESHDHGDGHDHGAHDDGDDGHHNEHQDNGNDDHDTNITASTK